MESRELAITAVEVAAYRIPTDAPEADGTLAWDATTLVVVEIAAGGERGLGYTYVDTSAARLIDGSLRDCLMGGNAMAIGLLGERMVKRVRNLGQRGIAAMAISAVDIALWDLKARLLGIPLATLLGQRREAAPLYGSGGFTSYDLERLCSQLGRWAEEGFQRVKMKVGTHPERDVARVRAAREAVGEGVGLMVDANGAYSDKQALALAEAFHAYGVDWFEEPLSSDDWRGLRGLRRRLPPGMELAAGEYGFRPDDFRLLLETRAVDVLQADVTRCGGITGFMAVAALCDAFHIPLSAHCAPTATLAVACAVPRFRHLEYFHDHVRIEQMLFDGAPAPSQGLLRPDLSRPGLGIALRRADAERFKVA